MGSRDVRTRAHLALLVATIVAVATMSFIPPGPDRCWTGPSLLAYGIVAGLVDTIHTFWPSAHLTSPGFVTIAVVNVIVFAVPAAVWYRKASQRAYIVGLIVWLVLYVFGSLISAPPAGCVSI